MVETQNQQNIKTCMTKKQIKIIRSLPRERRNVDGILMSIMQ